MSYSTNNLHFLNEFLFMEKLTKLFKLFLKFKGLSDIQFLPTGEKRLFKHFR